MIVSKTLKAYALGAVLLLLVILLLGIRHLVVQRDEARTAATTATAALTTANAAALDCNASVRRLQDEAAQAAVVHAPKIEQAAARNVTHTRKAQAILATPASVPDNVCLSAQERASAWLKGRQ